MKLVDYQKLDLKKPMKITNVTERKEKGGAITKGKNKKENKWITLLAQMTLAKI